jgi:uncharacterized iron-regulated membrane protein
MPRRWRTGLFWLHLALGVTVSLPVVPMAATGAMMSYRPELIAWAERDVKGVEGGLPRLLPSELLRRAKHELPSDAKLESLELERTPTAPAILGSENGFLLLDPYDGHVLRTSAVRRFFLAVEEVHWTVGLVLVRMRATGTALAGLVAIGLLLSSLSGPWLWWSRRLTPPQWGTRLPSSSASRSSSWHHLVGICCAPIILAASLTGILLHYEGAGVATLLGKTSDAQVMLDADSAVREAITRAPDWSALRLWWADDGVLTLHVRFGDGVRPTQWAKLDSGVPDESRAQTVTLRRYQDGRTGDKVLGWARWVHTGQALGRIGQAAWGFAALSILVLAWTGVMLALVRARRWFTNA